ncbi:MAG: hypothetical protein U1F43_02360 [Myxococcota bacterium]
MRAHLVLLCSLPLAAACDGASNSSPGQTRASLQPGADCGADFDACLASGSDPLACKLAFIDCTGEGAAPDSSGAPDGDKPDPVDPNGNPTPGDGSAADPWDQCKADFLACAGQGYDLALCLEKVRWCAGVCGPEAGGGGQPGDPCAPKLDACLASGGEPTACKDDYMACVESIGGTGSGTGDPGQPSEDPCMPIYDDCVKAGGDPVACKERYSECWGQLPSDPVDPGQPAPDACSADLDSCLASGYDPTACKEKFEACLGGSAGGYDPNGNPDGSKPDDGAGADGSTTDPATGSPCEDGFQACLRATPDGSALPACVAALEACKTAFDATR